MTELAFLIYYNIGASASIWRWKHDSTVFFWPEEGA